jgi:hypothetical protein
MEFSFKWRLTVRANHGSSLVALRVKTGSRHPGESSCIGIQAREAMVQRGIRGDTALILRWGKVTKGMLRCSYL